MNAVIKKKTTRHSETRTLIFHTYIFTNPVEGIILSGEPTH